MKSGAAIALAVALSSCNREAPTFELLQVPDGGPRAPTDATLPDLGVPNPGVDSGIVAAERADGLPCEQDEQCLGGICLGGDAFPEGYCSSRCTGDEDCTRPDGECVNDFGLRFCARTCFNGSICRANYECRPGPNGSDVCLPPLPGPGDGADGAPCARDNECMGARCFRDPDWPNGYCTTPDCYDSDLCHPGDHGARCAHITAPASTEYACLETCESVSDCRRGYACVPIALAHRACVPDVAELPPNLDPPESYPFELKCGATRLDARRFRFDFDVPMNATSYLVSPIARDGRYLLPLEIGLPSGGRIDFSGANRFQALTSIFRPWIAPTLIPTVSQLAAQLEHGAHTYTVESSSNDLCLQIVSESGDGTELDLRIYLVGLDGINAGNAGANPNLQAMLARTAELFAQVGLTQSDVVFRDLSAANAARYAMVMEDQHVGELVALSERGNGDLDSELVLNLFLVQTIGFGGGGILGIASALPGPAALHRTQASGVLATAEYLGLTEPGPNGEPQDGNEYTALVVVHELGHFLGLLHTSELGAEDRTFDPVIDTPECPLEVPLFECPDLGNVMFPFADPGNIFFSQGQGYTMKKNPTSKEPQ